MEDFQATTGYLNFNPPEIKKKNKKKTWQMREFHPRADKMLIKSRKLINFSVIEDKNKKAKEDRPRR